MQSNAVLYLNLASGGGMVAVAIAAVVICQLKCRSPLRWYWVSAGIWFLTVAIKFGIAIASNGAVLGHLKGVLSVPLWVVIGGLYVGFQSSLCEMGGTLLAGLIWRRMSREAGTAMTIGTGAGAFEAALLGLAGMIATAAALSGLEGTEEIRIPLEKAAAVTPVFWLVAPVERVTAVLCRVATRALILMGIATRRSALVVYGFVLFMLLDSGAGVIHLSGVMGTSSLWWVEGALLPFAFVSLPIIRWCWRHWPHEVAKDEAIAQ